MVSGFLALLGIRILISSFDDDSDGGGMAYSTRDSFQFSILEGSWDLTIGWEIFVSVTPLPYTYLDILRAISIIDGSIFFLSFWSQESIGVWTKPYSLQPPKECKPNSTESLPSQTKYLIKKKWHSLHRWLLNTANKIFLLVKLLHNYLKTKQAIQRKLKT